MKILIIEDDVDLRETVGRSLQRERYVVEAVSTLNEARQKVFIYEYDCILLDLMLPDGNGLDLLREMDSRDVDYNVIILSAKDSVEDKVDGLELGADDYLAKPFHLAELSARIRTVLRKKQRQGEMLMTLGNVVLSPRHFLVTVSGRPLDLGRKEYDILSYFMNRPGRLVEKQTLAEGVWGDYIDQVDNYDFIYAQIKNLRKKLKEAGADIELRTVYGFGYKLVLL